MKSFLNGPAQLHGKIFIVQICLLCSGLKILHDLTLLHSE